MNTQILFTIEGNLNANMFENDIFQISDIEIEDKGFQKGIDGMDAFIYLLSIGGGAIIIELSNVIKNLISKNNCKKVKIDDIEITGFSLEETTELIKELITLKCKTNKNEWYYRLLFWLITY